MDRPRNIQPQARGGALVAGGAGFIGSHVVEDLVARGVDVTVVDNLSTGSRQNLASVADRITFHERDLVTDDIRPLLAERSYDLIYHFAANASVPASVEEPRWDFELNVVTTLNLLDAIRDTSPDSTLLHASSALVYGEGATMPMQEGDPTFPVSPYGASKLAAERYVAVYAKVYGLRTANVRLFSTYGPRLRKQVVYDLMHKVHKNRPTSSTLSSSSSQRGAGRARSTTSPPTSRPRSASWPR
jgi:UDP-glucose 4-epimerase